MTINSPSQVLSHSTGSSQPCSLPTLSSCRGAILKKPDGKIVHGVPYDGLNDDDVCSVDSQNPAGGDWTDEREELLFQLQEFVNLNGNNVTADQTIKSYKLHSWIFIIL
jgi:hypothetical protein